MEAAFLFISQLAHQHSPIAITKTFIVFVFMAFTSVLFSHFYNRRRKLSVQQAPLPPGPKPWPLVGCLPTILTNKSPTYQWIHSVMKQFNTEIASIRLGNTYIIPVTSPELALQFLKTYDSIFASRSSISNTVDILSRGYLTTAFSSMGNQWKKMRRILASEVLNPTSLHQMLGQRTAEADNLLCYIFILTSKNGGGAVINVRSITQHYCGNIIRRMLFNRRYYGKGREDGGPTSEEEDHNEALLTILRHVNAFSISDFVPCLKPFDLDGHEKIMKKALNVVRKYDEPIIDERVQQWKDKKIRVIEDILDILISLKDDHGNSLLSIEEIKAQITELQIATIDNPSNAVEWAMAELINQPEILKKAVEELDEVVGRERLVEESDIPKLKYLTACIRESFRLHPFSPFNIPHVSNSDIIVNGYLIPKGSEVLLSRIGLGRNPRIWEDPMRFNPERHLKDDTMTELGISEPSLRFITFTRGRRGCVGSSLGTNITMMLFARLLQGFSWSLPPGITKMDFSETDHQLSVPTPLQLHAQPRLSHSMYPNLIDHEPRPT
ncbi:tryptophan N-monooxygenase CYP79A68-like [Benincasa hispida]|uniref:tryptophan N-monooxygenase CYP79A68-like n=1 Tax=Benincasa hispida TaxID=102211 RepID=UPI0019022B66|nr:tryptophan N-monooxygenase CYP79A68-like [Benincasa hispida]